MPLALAQKCQLWSVIGAERIFFTSLCVDNGQMGVNKPVNPVLIWTYTNSAYGPRESIA